MVQLPSLMSLDLVSLYGLRDDKHAETFPRRWQMSTVMSGRCVNLAAGNSGQPRINQLARDGLDAAFEKVLKLIQETELPVGTPHSCSNLPFLLLNV